MMYQAEWRVLHKKKAVQSPAATDTDQDASVHPIDPTAVPTSGVAALLLLSAQRVSVALTETAADARSEAATGETAIENANETANRDQDGSLVKAADASVALATTDELQEEGMNAIGGAVVAEAAEAAEGTKAAREVAIHRTKAMEKRRGGVRNAQSAL
jgi:hypothetical protein